MNPNDHPKPPPLGALGDIDPGEILARALHTAAPSPGATRWTPPAPKELARLLPQYQIESLLGHGGMGAVYRGVQAELDRPVAIKLLPAEMAADAQFIDRFRREARTLAKLQHPGIVAVFDFGQTTAGHLYFVMEYVDGTDLHRILHGPGLNPEQALELIGQICDALHYAHRHDVIHRDIKPGNILVTRDGRAKLADFGLARPVLEDTGGLTGTNVIMGTPDYMAPEQRSGGGHPDHRADIFSLGVMLYEMLTGQRPQGAFEPASKRVQVDVRIDEVVLKALQQEPDRRYQQVSEMKTDVDRIRTTPGVKAESGSRIAERKASRVRVAAVLAASLVLLSAGGFFFWKKAPQSTPALQRVEAPDGLKPSTTLAAATTPSPEALGETKKLLAEARAHAKAGDAPEARKLVDQALAIVSTDLGIMAEAALVLADAQAPERAGRLADDFAQRAPVTHPLFAPVAEARVKLTAQRKKYEAHLRTAAERIGAGDDTAELRALQAAAEIFPDGAAAQARLAANPLHLGKPLPGRRWTNDLGQKFVPVEGLANVLFSALETRVQDFAAFVKETDHRAATVVDGASNVPKPSDAPRSWMAPGWEQTADHPVTCVSMWDALAFCHWLTKKGRAAGHLLPGQEYRLPTDREWSAAMGVRDEAGDFPSERKFPTDVLPAPLGKAPKLARNAENLKGKDDDHPFTAPTGSGVANRFGIFDLLGNVSELCLDTWQFPGHGDAATMRGGSFRMGFDARNFVHAVFDKSTDRSRGGLDRGFRCVLDFKTPAQRTIQEAMEAAVFAFCTGGQGGGQGKIDRIITLVNDEAVSLNLSYVAVQPADRGLRFFSDLPLTTLYLRRGKNMANFKGAPLRHLRLTDMEQEDLAALAGMPLERLSLHGPGSSITSLSGLEGLPIKRLYVGRFLALEDVTALRGMPLEDVGFETTPKLSDLSPLREAKLTQFRVSSGMSFESLLQAGDWWTDSLDGVGSVERVVFPEVAAAIAKQDIARLERIVPALKEKFPKAVGFNGERLKAQVELGVQIIRWQRGERSPLASQIKRFQEHAYLAVEYPMEFEAAGEMARLLGGHLLTLTSQEEQDFVRKELAGPNVKAKRHLGLQRSEDDARWTWGTGEPLEFQKWRPNDADEGTTAVITFSPGRAPVWSSQDGEAASFIIEWDTPNPETQPGGAK